LRSFGDGGRRSISEVVVQYDGDAGRIRRSPPRRLCDRRTAALEDGQRRAHDIASAGARGLRSSGSMKLQKIRGGPGHRVGSRNASTFNARSGATCACRQCNDDSHAERSS
jgi:hypothetical protein